MKNHFDTIIIGAGQVGLAAGFYLKKQSKDFMILEKGSVPGQAWKDRYDSLVLFTPVPYDSLPGYPFPATQGEYPTKKEVSSYLEAYARFHQLPIRFQTTVYGLQKNAFGFTLETSRGNYHATNVIVATGPFQKPWIPPYPGQEESPILQLHSSQYRNDAQIPEGSVLVVGAGNSGAQIAVELSKKHPTYLSIRKKLRFKSLTLLGKSIFWWGTTLGILHAPTHSWIAKKLRAQGDPIYGKELKDLLKEKKISLLPEISHFEGSTLLLVSGQSLQVNAIIWSTGFREDFNWINIPELFTNQDQLQHREGISPIKGLYFLGLSWQRARSSALIMGAGRDAQFIVNHLMQH